MPVSESDQAISADRVSLRRPDGMIEAYAAFPRQARATTPGLVLVMDATGVDDHLRDVARRFAKAGYACIVPDLSARLESRKQTNGDLRAAALYLLAKAPNCKIGVIGFGNGGNIALIQALDNADVFDAAATFYGSLKDIGPLDLHIPILASYGEKDPAISAEEVRVWRTALRVPNDVRVYGSAGHAFFDETRTSYVHSAADDAWKRVLAFFKEHLGLES